MRVIDLKLGEDGIYKPEKDVHTDKQRKKYQNKYEFIIDKAEKTTQILQGIKEFAELFQRYKKIIS